jgi:hypothetical protein
MTGLALMTRTLANPLQLFYPHIDILGDYLAEAVLRRHQ